MVLFLLSPGVTLRGDHYNRSKAARAQIAQLMSALKTYRSDIGDFPTEEQGLQALRSNPGVHGWHGPYLDRDIPVDPWGHPYRYSVIDGRPGISSPGSHEPIANSQ